MKHLTAVLIVALAVLLVACGTAGTATPASPSPAPVTIPAAGGEQETMAPPATASDEYAAARARMVEEGIRWMGVSDESVVAVMARVPRHRFVPQEWLAQAYENHPLPIGHGQTISQPFIVALMTEAAEVEAGDRVLEIGTGSGYQAAVLAEIAGHVYSVEIIGALADRAEGTLAELGYDNVSVRHGDGYFGWEEEAPFDAIVVTAAPDHIPQPLVAQLRVGGHMIIPVGPVGGYQTLWRVTKVSEAEVRTEDLGGVRFVPFTREEPAE
jgi:protein-L-isoaspartate(D-aspartate) O-methyltransferase